MTVGNDIRITVHDADGAELSRRSFSGPRVRIGRVQSIADGSNDIVLPDDFVSREHAQLLVQDGAITVVDLRSNNGTMVNGQMIHERRVLQPGDDIGIGPYLLRCDASRPAAPPRTTAAPLAPRPAAPREPVAPTTAELAPVDPDLPDFDLPDPAQPALDRPADGDVDLDLAPAPDPVAADTSRPDLARPDLARPDLADPDLADPDLAAAYRALARQHGAPAWGRPSPLTPTDWGRALASVRAVVRAPLWPERLADELCGAGPLAALLDDPGVTAITVCGAGPIQVRRGEARELASARFSCPEALFACYERWTGVALADADTACVQLAADLRVVTMGRALAPGGPVLHVVRGGPLRGLAELALPPAAAALLGAALDRRARVVVHGDAAADLSFVAAALAARRPPEQLAVRIARSAAWPGDPALVVLAGERPDALRCARRLHADWLIVEELAPGDALDLRAALAGPAGVLATLRARTGEAALQRLASALAAASDAEPRACRAELAHGLDLFVGVRHVGGHPRVHSISELRPGDRGELVDLFILQPDHAALEPTGVEPQTLRERSP